jgi:hypothetical protein
MVDLDNKYAYIYAAYKTANGETVYYLNRVNTLSSEMKAEFVGVLADGHMVSEPSKEEGINSDIWIY